MVDEVHMEVNLGKHGWIIIGKYPFNLYLGWTIIWGENAKDTCLILEGQGTETKGARRSPRGDKSNLVLSIEKKTKEGQSGHPLRIKCTATT